MKGAKSKESSLTQPERFLDDARSLGCDESEARFDAALKQIGKAKLTHPPRPAKAKKEKPAK
jgi:hypothetical protein